MNVVLFTDTYPPEINGVATSLFNLHKTLVEHGDRCLVVTSNSSSKDTEVDGDVIRLPGIEAMKGYDYHLSAGYNRKAFRLVKEFQPDIIHSNHDALIGQFGFICARKLNIPVVYTYHTMYEDYTYYVTKGYFDRFAKQLVRGYINMKSNQADELIAPSEKVKTYFRSIGVDRFINVVPTGIDFAKFALPKDKGDILERKKKLGIGPKDFVLFYLGRIAKEKSLDVLLRGYAQYRGENPKKPTKFLVVGGGPLLEEMKAMSKELGIADSVIFVGPVPAEETPLYYQLGDLFLSASLTETQGLTIMEAMISSMLVLARYDDNLSGTIVEGKTGFFFYGEEDFKDRLSDIVALPESGKKSIVSNALKSLEPYSLDSFYSNIHEVYLRAIKKNW